MYACRYLFNYITALKAREPLPVGIMANLVCLKGPGRIRHLRTFKAADPLLVAHHPWVDPGSPGAMAIWPSRSSPAASMGSGNLPQNKY